MLTISGNMKQRFADHEVQRHEKLAGAGAVVEVLHWRRADGSSNGLIDYVRYGSTLFVRGDYGDAVYQWYGDPPTTLDWIAGLDLDYFAGKCQASPYGRGFQSWDSDRCEKWFQRHLDDYDANVRRDLVHERWNESTCHREEWASFLESNEENPAIGDDWGELANIGMGVDWQCEAHLAGLQLAMASLRAAA